MKIKLTVILLLLGISCLESQPWYWSISQLFYPRVGLSATVLDDSIFYSGGKGYGTFENLVEVYDLGDPSWSMIGLQSTPRWQTSAVSCNGKVFFAGGNNYPGSSSYKDVDVYDNDSKEWTVEYLSEPRSLIGTVAHMNKVFFAGGLHYGAGIFYDVVDIYNTETETWDTSIYLTEPKCAIGATAAGGKVFFAGGATAYGVVTNVVEVYHIDDEVWTYTSLSEHRAYVAAVAYENMVYFAGGTTCDEGSNVCDEGSNVVDIYNVEDPQWESPQTLSFPRVVRALKVKNALVFSGECDYIDENGVYWNANGVINIYYPEENVWDFSVPDLSPDRIWYACAAYDDRAYYAGGRTSATEFTDIINILKNDYQTGFHESKFTGLKIQVSPNPFYSNIHIDFYLQQPGEVHISIYDNSGKQVGIVVNEYQYKGNQQVMFNSEKLKPGIYFCALKTSMGIQTTKMIKL